MDLEWTASDPEGDSMSFDVFFGSAENPPLRASGVLTNKLGVYVAPGKTYYWKVVARDERGASNESSIWSFSIRYEKVLDSINDSKEKLVSKYNPEFDWKTQSPSKQDILQALINAVILYFKTWDGEARQEILNDVVELVRLYFSLPAYEAILAIAWILIVTIVLKKSR